MSSSSLRRRRNSTDDNDNNERFADDEANEKLYAPPDWDGPIRKRHCTDILCLILLLASWAGLTWVGAYALRNGDYRLVLYPLDYDGNVCGTDFGPSGNMTDFPYLLYVNSYGGGVCVKDCPSLSSVGSEEGVVDLRTLITYSGVWQAPETEDDGSMITPLLNASDYVQVGDYSQSEDALSCTTDLCFPNPTDVSSSWTSVGIAKGFGFAYYAADTYSLFQRCYLTAESEVQIANMLNLTQSVLPNDPLSFASYDFLINLYGDLWTARNYILGIGFGGSLGVSLIYILLLRLPCLLHSLVWGSVVGTIGIVTLGGYYAYSNAEEWASQLNASVRDQTIQYTRIFAYVLWTMAGILVVLALCFRRAIQVSIACVQQAGRAVHQMVALLVLPLIQSVAVGIFWIVWIIYAVYLISLGNITTREYQLDYEGTEIAVRQYEFDTFVYLCGWYLLFCLYWTVGFLVAFGDMVVAVAVSKWYFCHEKSQINSCTVASSFCTTLVHHLGTCAYGALLITVLKIIRTILAKIQREVAKLSNNTIASCLLCCCQCCFCCLEKCLKFINKQAYVQTAIFGTPFLTSARRGFFLVLRNVRRVGALSVISGAVLWVGKLFVACATTLIAYYALIESDLELWSYGAPLVLIFLLSMAIADMWMDVYEIAILTTLHCFVADEEMFGGSPKYAQGSLSSWMDKNDFEDSY